MKLNRQTIIVIVVLIVVIVVATFGLLVFPQFGKLATLGSEIEAANVEVAAAETLLARRQAAKNNTAFTEAEILRLASELPESPELPSVIIELQDLMNRVDLEFASLSPMAPRDEEGGYSSIGINMQFTGEWLDVVDLLQSIRNLTRQVRILNFSATQFVPPESEEDTTTVANMNLVQISMTIEVYTMAQTDSAGAVAAPAQ